MKTSTHREKNKWQSFVELYRQTIDYRPHLSQYIGSGFGRGPKAGCLIGAIKVHINVPIESHTLRCVVSYSTQFWCYLVVTHTLNSWSVHFLPISTCCWWSLHSSGQKKMTMLLALGHGKDIGYVFWWHPRACRKSEISILCAKSAPFGGWKHVGFSWNPHDLWRKSHLFPSSAVFPAGEKVVKSTKSQFFRENHPTWQKSADISCSFLLWSSHFSMFSHDVPIVSCVERLESGEGQEGQAAHFDLEGFVVDHGPCWWPVTGQKTMGIWSIKTMGFLVSFCCIFCFWISKNALTTCFFLNTIDMKTEDFSIQALEHMYVYIYIIIEYSPIQTSIMMASAWKLQFEHQQKDCEWGR